MQKKKRGFANKNTVNSYDGKVKEDSARAKERGWIRKVEKYGFEKEFERYRWDHRTKKRKKDPWPRVSAQ